MNSLRHSWKITTNYLEAAYKFLPNELESETTNNYIEYIKNNEFELAMNALMISALCSTHQMNFGFNLNKQLQIWSYYIAPRNSTECNSNNKPSHQAKYKNE